MYSSSLRTELLECHVDGHRGRTVAKCTASEYTMHDWRLWMPSWPRSQILHATILVSNSARYAVSLGAWEGRFDGRDTVYTHVLEPSKLEFL